MGDPNGQAERETNWVLYTLAMSRQRGRCIGRGKQMVMAAALPVLAGVVVRLSDNAKWAWMLLCFAVFVGGTWFRKLNRTD